MGVIACKVRSSTVYSYIDNYLLWRMGPKFIITRTNTGNSSFNLIAGNGDKVLNGGQYNTSSACHHAVKTVKEISTFDQSFEKKQTSSGQHYFVIKDHSGVVLAT